jgi:hypothetical protein
MTDSDSTSDQASTPDFPVIRTNSKPASPSLRRPVRNYTSIEGHTRFLQFLQFLVVALTVALLVLAVNHTFLLDVDLLQELDEASTPGLFAKQGDGDR